MRAFVKSVAAAVGLVMLNACSVFGHNPGLEQPAYEVVRKADNIEIRRYKDLLVASTTVDGDYDDMTGEGFMRLFRYIDGANTATDKIAMTAPVLMEERSRKIAMTAPVLNQKKASGGWTMSFILPSQYTMETAPRPQNDLVELRTIPGRTVGAITFAGFLNEAGIARNKQALAQWLTANGYDFDSQVYEAAGYNPPFTLPPLRRNEVLIPVFGGS